MRVVVWKEGEEVVFYKGIVGRRMWMGCGGVGAVLKRPKFFF